VVVTHDDRGYRLALQLKDAGVGVAAIVDNRADAPAFASGEARKAKQAQIPIHPQFDIEAALGRRHLKGVRCKPTRGSIRPKLLKECDVLCICGSRVPANELIFQRTGQGEYILESPNQFTRKPVTSEHLRVEADMYVAGGANGSRSFKQSWIEGQVAGLSAALDLGYGGQEAERDRDEAQALLDEPRV
jgi:sarcosine oxidase subunit alpha